MLLRAEPNNFPIESKFPEHKIPIDQQGHESCQSCKKKGLGRVELWPSSFFLAVMEPEFAADKGA